MKNDQNRLITIPISHYCEKARWALDRAQIPYREERHLQLFHVLPSMRAARQDEVPILITPQGIQSDSTDILKWAHEMKPENGLYPSDPTLRRETEEWEDELDEGFGVAGRLWMYTYMLSETPTAIRYSRKHGVPGYQNFLFPFLFPFVKKLIQKALHMKPESRAEAKAEIDAVFEKVTQRLETHGPFLMGDRFTAADLTFAALSAAVLLPENYGVELPQPDEVPPEMGAQVKAWRAHPAGQFALKMFREERSFKQAI